MANVSVYNMEGKEVGTMELNDAVFGVEINDHLVHLAVVRQLANNRQGTQKAKTRSEVSGGGRKPWRQKGTGHARQGSIRAPQWTGGGVVFAPTPRYAAEVTYTRQCQVDQAVCELVHFLATKGNFASDRHTLTDFKVCYGIFRFGGNCFQIGRASCRERV